MTKSKNTYSWGQNGYKTLNEARSSAIRKIKEGTNGTIGISRNGKHIGDVEERFTNMTRTFVWIIPKETEVKYDVMSNSHYVRYTKKETYKLNPNGSTAGKIR